MAQHDFHAQDAEKLQQPVSAKLAGVALKRRKRLLRDAQTQGNRSLGQASLFAEGPEQGGKLVRRADGEVGHANP